MSQDLFWGEKSNTVPVEFENASGGSSEGQMVWDTNYSYFGEKTKALNLNSLFRTVNTNTMFVIYFVYILKVDLCAH